MTGLRRLFDHLRWADDKTFAALKEQKNAPPAMLERFMHVIAAEHVWLSRIRGEPAKVAVWPQFTADGCARLMATNQREFAALIDDPQTWARMVGYTTSDGRKFTNEVGDILLHVALHGQWHRGQVAMLMRQAGMEPVPTDYIAFARGADTAKRMD